jgi:hypothetical protein
VRVVGQQGLQGSQRAADLRGDRRPHDLAGDHGRAGIVEVRLEVGDPEGVDVAADDHGVAGLPLPEILHESAARGRVAVPSVRAEQLARPGLAIELGHQRLLGDHVPAGARAIEPVAQPALLRVAEDGQAGIAPLGAVVDGGAAAAGRHARLVRAVLPVVEHVELHEVAERRPVVDPRVRPERHHLAAQREVLVVGLVPGRAPTQEPLARVQLLRAIVRVVVGDLVIVPRDDPRVRGVGRLQIRVGLVERIAQAIVVERHRLGPAVLAHAREARRVLVDVVAEKDDQVEVVAEHPPVGAEVAELPVLARGEGHAQAVERRVRRRGRARPADGAHLTARAKAIPVPARGLEAVDLDVHGVRPVRRGRRRAALDDVAHALVGRDLPLDRHGLARRAGAGQHRRRRDPGPQHDARGERIPGCDAERERITAEPRLPGGASQERRRDLHDTEHGGADQELPTTHARRRDAHVAASLARFDTGLGRWHSAPRPSCHLQPERSQL